MKGSDPSRSSSANHSDTFANMGSTSTPRAVRLTFTPLGTLLTFRDRGVLPVLRPTLDALVASGFRIAPHRYDRVLSDAGEAP
jgi:hypothetical protein